mgnify:CR=1 FL=1|tara:strand:+ start:3400 stop:3624 length:225 start_codon:yes stop_codon:yes gene_type:complete
MILDLFILNGYGQFVWPAFLFTFCSCFLLFIKTKKEFQKLEKIYLDKNLNYQNIEIKYIKTKKETKEILSGSSI